MWQRIQTFVFVTLITGLIWLYAESESLETKTFSMEIEFVTSGPKLWIEPTQPTRTPIVTFQGPRWRMSQVADQLRKGPIQLQMNPDPTGRDINQTVNLKQRLSQLDVFKGLGVTIDSVEPATQQVQVESYVFQTLSILAMLEGKVNIDATIEPAVAKIGVPARYLSDIEDNNVRILAELRIDDPQLNKQIVVENVALSFSDLVPSPLVSIEPKSVTVTLTVTSTNIDSKPQNLPVDIRIPLAEIAKYEFQFENLQSGTARKVVFNGPEEIIAQIDADVEARKMLVKAFLHLGADDLAKAAANTDKSITRQVQFELPPNMIVAHPPDAISFKVIARPKSAGALDESANGP